MVENGLIKRWEEYHARRDSKCSESRSLKLSNNIIELADIYGAIMLLGGGLCLALAAMAGEWFMQLMSCCYINFHTARDLIENVCTSHPHFPIP